MKQLFLVLASVICICYTTKSYGQENQKTLNIILDDKNNESETTIEVKDGQLFVDGQKISDLEKNTSIKIVKKNTLQDQHPFNFDLGSMDSPFRPHTLNRKAMLGVQTADAHPGAEIKEVIKGSAAEKAGLKAGDIILAIDEENIQNTADLIAKISGHDKDDAIKIQIERNGKADQLTATLEAANANSFPLNQEQGGGQFSMPFQHFEELFSLRDGDSTTSSMPHSWNNNPRMRIEDFFGTDRIEVKRTDAATPKIGLELEENIDGLEIINIEEEGAADKAGLRKGDKLKAIEGQKVKSLEEAKSILQRSQDKHKVDIEILRQGALKNLPVVLPQVKRRAQF